VKAARCLVCCDICRLSWTPGRHSSCPEQLQAVGLQAGMTRANMLEWTRTLLMYCLQCSACKSASLSQTVLSWAVPHLLCLLLQVARASAGRCLHRPLTATACQPTSSTTSSSSSTAAAAAARSAAAGPRCTTAVSCRPQLVPAPVRAWICRHTSWPVIRYGMRCAAEQLVARDSLNAMAALASSCRVDAVVSGKVAFSGAFLQERCTLSSRD
jgi:hypothetical protein